MKVQDQHQIKPKTQSCQMAVSGSVMASQLRIGNLVIVDNEKYHPKLKDVVLEITEINESMGFDFKNSHGIGLKHINQKPYTYYERYSQLIAFIKPIPLTEEWLLKFGFVKYGTLHDSYKLNPFIVELGILGNHYTFRKIMNKDESILLKEMKYVHELQNIYKELKGYELPSKTKI